MSDDLIERPGGPLEWLIRKGAYFYRPNKSGYTTVKSEAGRYAEWDARREAEIEPWHMEAIHQDNVPDPVGDINVSEIASLRDALAAKDTELSELREELGRVKAINANLMGDDETVPRYTMRRMKQEVAARTEVSQARAATAEAELERARKALEKHGVDFDG